MTEPVETTSYILMDLPEEIDELMQAGATFKIKNINQPNPVLVLPNGAQLRSEYKELTGTNMIFTPDAGVEKLLTKTESMLQVIPKPGPPKLPPRKKGPSRNMLAKKHAAAAKKIAKQMARGESFRPGGRAAAAKPSQEQEQQEQQHDDQQRMQQLAERQETQPAVHDQPRPSDPQPAAAPAPHATPQDEHMQDRSS